MCSSSGSIPSTSFNALARDGRASDLALRSKCALFNVLEVSVSLSVGGSGEDA
jgi:hypothetical protein